MLINKVAKECHLTKKAIEYYTEQKLLCPTILENGYRDFSKLDIQKLEQIALYRKLGLSTSEIKTIFLYPDERKNILYKRMIELEKEKVKQEILQKLCNGEKLENLEQEINGISLNSAIIKKLMDFFPSYYGKFISLNFSSYLTGKIETEEQRQAFKEIIDFLDNVPDFSIPEDLQDYLENYLEEYSSDIGVNRVYKIRQLNKKSLENIDQFVAQNEKVLKEYRDYKETEEYRNSPAYRLMQLMKQFCITNGYYDKFIPAMRRLSPSYNEYYEQLMKASNVIQ